MGITMMPRSGRILTILLCALPLCALPLRAQPWPRVLPDVPVADIYGLAHWNGDTLFAAGSNWTLLRSVDNGLSWTGMFPKFCARSIRRIGSDGRRLWFLTRCIGEETQDDYADSSVVNLYAYDVARNDTTRVVVPLPHLQTVAAGEDLSVSRSCITLLQYEGWSRYVLAQSTDDGATWQTRRLPDSIRCCIQVEFADADNGLLLASTERCSTAKEYHAYLTRDGGRTLELVPGVTYPTTAFTAYDNFSLFAKLPCGWFNDTVAVLAPDGHRLCFSMDRGSTWRFSPPSAFFIQAVTVDERNRCIAAGDSLGVYGFDLDAYAPSGAGPAWETLRGTSTIHLRLFSSIVAGTAGTLVAASTYGYIVQSGDAGRSWRDIHLDRHSVITNLGFFDGTHGWMHYIDIPAGKYTTGVTTDGGVTWRQPIVDPDPARHSFEFRFVGRDVALAYKSPPAYAGTEIDISTDGGAHWAVSYGAPAGDDVRFLAQTNQSRLIRSDSDFLLATSRGLLHTTDRGASWTMRPAFASITGVANPPEIDMRFRNHGWLLTGERLYRTDDEGATWLPVDHYPDIGRVETFTYLDVIDGTALNVVSPSKILYSSNAGDTWKYIRPPVNTIQMRTFPDGTSYGFAIGAKALSWSLYKSTDNWQRTAQPIYHNSSHGQNWLFALDERTLWVNNFVGIWTSTNGGVSWRETPRPADAAPLLLSMHPNPAGAAVTVSVETARPDPVAIELRDVLGRRVRSLSIDAPASGARHCAVDCAQLRSGVYLVTATSGRSSTTRPLVVAR